MPGHAIPQGFPGRTDMRAEQAVLADHIAHGHLACIDRFNLLSQVLAALDGRALPIGVWDDHHDRQAELKVQPANRQEP